MPGNDAISSAISSAATGFNPLSLVAPTLSAVEGGVQFFSNLGKEKRDRAELNNMQNPFYNIQNEYYQNRNMAGDLAQGGTPTASKDYATQESDRGLGTGISGELQAGGNPNDINRLYQSFNNNIDRTAAADAEQHVKNIQYYQDQNANVAAQKNIQFGFNKVQPFQRKLAQLTGNLATDQINANNGANQTIGSIGSLATGQENNSLLNALFKKPATADAGSSTNSTGLINSSI